MTSPRAALYARVSDTDKRKNNDPWDSLPRQVEDLHELARRWGFEVVMVVDEKISGAKERPGWGRMMESVRAGEVDVVCAVAFDRLTRSERIGDFEDLKAELRAQAVRLVTVKQGEIVLSGTADAEMLSDVQAVWAKGERLKIRERTLTARVARARAGEYVGGRTPYGYTAAFDSGTGKRVFTIHEEHAAVVRQLYGWVDEGVSLNEMMRRLIASGIPSHNGKRWGVGAVRGLLRRPSYAGFQPFRSDAGPLVPGPFPPIVSEEQWMRVQQELVIRAKRIPRGPHKTHPLTGIIACPFCGRTMNTVRNESVTYYRCGYRRDWIKTPCMNRVYFNIDATHRAVLDFLRQHLQGGKPKRAKRKPDTPRPSEVARLEAERDKKEAERTRLLRWMLEGTIEEADGQVLLGEMRTSIKHLGERITEERKREAAAPPVTEAPVDLAPWVTLLGEVAKDPDDLRKLFHLMLESVVVERVGLTSGVFGGRRQVLKVREATLRGGHRLGEIV